MSIDEDIPVSVLLTDLEIPQAAYEQNQALKVDDSDGDECVKENPPTNAGMRSEYPYCYLRRPDIQFTLALGQDRGPEITKTLNVHKCVNVIED
ncbi:hypothetical protein AVEN_179497-1 [Araneus ventricosus]|uniref:Uncharacterized protein n=1 Tax=Araneus ventricosus TaxID=182803 RepID=A0A4Y2BEX8_ARAVE|nr:hypothetical protein AVEN_179497-1 [Araneus ventricosus]